MPAKEKKERIIKNIILFFQKYERVSEIVKSSLLSDIIFPSRITTKVIKLANYKTKVMLFQLSVAIRSLSSVTERKWLFVAES